MKTVIFMVSGKPEKGDVLVLSGGPPGGGQSNAQYFCRGETVEAYLDDFGVPQKRVTPAETPAELAQGMADAFNMSREFVREHATARAAGDMVMLALSEVYDSMRWYPQVRDKDGNVNFNDVLRVTLKEVT